MKAINNFSNISAAGNNTRLTAGGYVCRITSVKDNKDNERLEFEFDIAEGDFKNYSSDMLERFGWTSCKFIKSYKEKALGFFKAFMIAVDETNKTNFAKMVDKGLDETKLIGKGIGIVIGEEEYRKRDGSIGTRIYADTFTTANAIRNGEFTVPALKKMANTESVLSGGSFESMMDAPADDGDLPF